MTFLLITTLAFASPAERVAKLHEKQDWARTHEACDRADIAASTQPHLREMCAEAALKHAAPADTAEAWEAFSVRWTGTASGRAAFEQAAALAMPAPGATEAQFLQHAGHYTGTEAAARSWVQAEQRGFDAASQQATFTAWAGFLSTYPDGTKRAEARARTLQAGIAELSAGSDAARWQELVDVLPESLPAIHRAGERWAAQQVRAHLQGPCWDAPCDRLVAGSRIELPTVSLPWSAHPKARWVALGASGQPVSDDLLARGLGLTLSELSALTDVSARLGSSIWTAPVDWAQPPSALKARWALEIQVGDSPPVRVPAQLEARWKPAGAGGLALAHWSTDGLHVHGPTGSQQWSALSAPRGTDRTELVANTTHLFLPSGSALHAVSRTGGAPTSIPLPMPGDQPRKAGEFIWFEAGPQRFVCDIDGCSAPFDADPVAVSAATGRYLVREDAGAFSRWNVHSLDGDLESSSRLPAGDGPGRGAVAQFDEAGDRVAVVTAQDGGQSHLLRVFEARSGAVVAEKRFATQGTRYADMTRDGLVSLASSSSGWVLTTAEASGTGQRVATVRVAGGRFVVQPAEATAAIGSVVGRYPSPDGKGHLEADAVVLPSGRVVRLPPGGSVLWMAAPLAVRLQVDGAD